MALLAIPASPQGLQSLDEAFGPGPQQTAEETFEAPRANEDFAVYRTPPRLFLEEQRLRRLQREPERQALRWDAFRRLMDGGAPMPEPGFAHALYFMSTGQPDHARTAIDWAVTEADPAELGQLRQLALVFDWLAENPDAGMTSTEAGTIAGKLESGLPSLNAVSVETITIRQQSARALAVVALADRLEDHGEQTMREIVQDWWRRRMVPQIESGEGLTRNQLFFFYELMHAVRDNLRIDLRADIPGYFLALPLDYLTGHYPARFPAPENEYRIPVYLRDGPPAVEDAVLSRAAGLALTGYDTNDLNSQFVQGWLMLDAFLMRSPLGVPYEYLWANPYQPGLSYQTLPLVFHDPDTGNVFARTSWDDSATWLGYFDGRLQLFRDGGIQSLAPGAHLDPIRIGDVLLTSSDTNGVTEPARTEISAPTLYWLGLTPRATYGVEIDNQELDLVSTDAGGTLVLQVTEGVEAGVRANRR